MWCPHDRLITHLIHLHIKSTFKHVIDEKCAHMRGPSAIKGIHRKINRAIGKHAYFIRLDIKGFYESIDRGILLERVKNIYQDPIIVRYLDDIINIPYDLRGNVYTPKNGIPTGSSLSPFFAALSLKALDYVRYRGLLLILLPNQKAFQKAKKKVFKVLRDLKLERSPQKTLMGKLSEKAFHYLGLSYDWTQTQPQSQTQVKVHTRTCQRALSHIRLRTYNTGRHKPSPVTDQRYLRRWAAWWHFDALTLLPDDIIMEWIRFTDHQAPHLSWLGEELLLR